MNAEDDGYVTPEFDLPSASAFESSEHDDAPLQKRQNLEKDSGFSAHGTS